MPVQDDDLRNKIALVIDANYHTAISKALSTADQIIEQALSPTPDTDQQAGTSPLATGLSQAEPEVSALRASIPSAHESHCPPPTLGRCNCRVADLAIVLGRALKESCVHLGECYAVADERVAYDGDISAEVDGEISLMALAEAAIMHLTASGTEAGTGETEGLDPKDDGPVGATGAETPNTSPDTGLIEALKKCRDKFSDYAAQHEAKWRTEVRRDEAEARNEKMIRNREMAEMCDTALANAAPAQPESGK